MQSIVVALHISLELVEYGLCVFPPNEIPAFLTPAVPFPELIFCSCANKFIPRSGLRKGKCEGVNLCLEPQAKGTVLLSWLRTSMPGRIVIISIMLGFLLGSRCPAHGLCMATAQQNSGKDRSDPCWVLFPHSLKGEGLWGCCLVLRAVTDVESTPEWHRKCWFTHISSCYCIHWWVLVVLPIILGGKFFCSHKFHARTWFIWSEDGSSDLCFQSVLAKILQASSILRRNPIFSILPVICTEIHGYYIECYMCAWVGM